MAYCVLQENSYNTRANSIFHFVYTLLSLHELTSTKRKCTMMFILLTSYNKSRIRRIIDAPNIFFPEFTEPYDCS